MLCVGFVVCFLVTGAEASIVKFIYEGKDLELEVGEANAPSQILGISGHMEIDESITGRLQNRTLKFTAAHHTNNVTDYNSGNPVPWIASWSFRAASGWAISLYPTVLNDFSVTFGEYLQITEWKIRVLDGPPDFFMSNLSDGVRIFNPDFASYGGEGGTWVPTGIPLPASFFCTLLALLSALWVARRPNVTRCA